MLLIAVAACALAAALLVLPAQGASRKPKPVSVKVGDDFYSCTHCGHPPKLTIRRGTTVVWHWSDANQDVHDVRLKSGPKHVRKFRSEIAGGGYTYKRTLTVKGTYKLYCTIHASVMKMTIVVK